MSKRQRQRRRDAKARQSAAAAVADAPILTAPGLAPRAQFDAIQDKKKRTAPRTTTRSQDSELTTGGRTKLVATARDQLQNAVLLRWMVNKHLDYVSQAYLQARTPDRGFNREFEAFMSEQARADRFDAAGRHDLDSMMEISEGLRVVDGDVYWLKLASGHIQAIESDRVHCPAGMDEKQTTGRNWIHGVDCTTAGRAKAYSICKRGGVNASQRIFERVIPAQNIFPYGYFSRIDQVRGISPLASILNTMQDLYEVLDYSVIKAKLHAMLGFAVRKKLAQGAGGLPITDTATAGTEATDDDAGTTTHETVAANVKPGIINIFDLDTDEAVDILESRSPSLEFQAFSEFLVKLSLLALDIPFIFFDALKGSYSVHRTTSIGYEKSCLRKRRAMLTLRNRWTRWRAGLALFRGDFALPKTWTLADVKWEWVPSGTPWIDPLKEVKAAGEAISMGLSSPQTECRKLGRDFEDMVLQIAEARAFAHENNVPLTYGSITDDVVAAALLAEGKDE